jgi:hypothetical protein
MGVIDLAEPGACIYKDNPYANSMSSLATTALSLFLLLINIILFLIDIIIFLKQSGCGIKRFFVIEDPFGFRFEQIGIVLMFAVTVGLSIFPIAASSGSTVNVRSSGYQTQSIILAVAYFFFEIGLLVASCGVGLILAIISFIKSKTRNSLVFDSEFVAFINTKEGIRIFKEYSKKEWSSENVLFFEDVMKYKQIKKFKLAQKHALHIKDSYIEIGSPFEVNLSGDARKLTKTKVEELQTRDSDSNFSNIFEEAMKETKRNMKDTFGRIRQTSEFKEWKEKSNVIIEDKPEVMN